MKHVFRKLLSNRHYRNRLQQLQDTQTDEGQILRRKRNCS